MANRNNSALSPTNDECGSSTMPDNRARKRSQHQAFLSNLYSTKKRRISQASIDFGSVLPEEPDSRQEVNRGTAVSRVLNRLDLRSAVRSEATTPYPIGPVHPHQAEKRAPAQRDAADEPDWSSAGRLERKGAQFPGAGREL